MIRGGGGSFFLKFVQQISTNRNKSLFSDQHVNFNRKKKLPQGKPHVSLLNYMHHHILFCNYYGALLEKILFYFVKLKINLFILLKRKNMF